MRHFIALAILVIIGTLCAWALMGAPAVGEPAAAKSPTAAERMARVSYADAARLGRNARLCDAGNKKACARMDAQLSALVK